MVYTTTDDSDNARVNMTTDTDRISKANIEGVMGHKANESGDEKDRGG